MPPKKRSQYSSLPFTAVFSEPEQEMVPSLPYKSHALEDGELWRAELEEDGPPATLEAAALWTACASGRPPPGGSAEGSLNSGEGSLY